MSLLQKAHSRTYIDKVFLDYTGQLSSVYASSYQNFYNATGSLFQWEELYFTKPTISLSESHKITKAGDEYTQKLQLTFPNSDAKRTDRIQLLKKMKFIQLELSNGNKLILGRNDYYQNKLPQVKVTSTHNKSVFSFTTKTIVPLGFLNGLDTSNYIDFLIPNIIPVV